jgi:predicted esterase
VAEERLDALDHAIRMANRALTGGLLGAPTLPPVYADSPRDDPRFADRFPPGQASDSPGDASLITHIIPAGAGGTETPVAEILQYQLPDLYDELGPPHPLVIAYHGYGASSQSVANQSTLDEECNARNWIYLSPTGMDDQLFGSGPSQQNTEAAIRYMLDNFHVDEERLYMVGFSMGAGIAANFTAQHRDPDGIMIAALGLLSGTYDWTMAYSTGTPDLQLFMQHELHFGGSPTNLPFEYKRWSTLYFDPASYPPIPGALITAESMALNLGDTPVYMTWDTTDPQLQVLKQNARLVNVLEALGGTLEWKTVTATFDPVSGTLKPHSWLVLDEADLCDFFQDKLLDRKPDGFRALLDEGGPVAWMSVVQRLAGQFSAVQASALPGIEESAEPALAVTLVNNCVQLEADLAATQIAGEDPIALTAESLDFFGFRLVLAGAACPPVYLLDSELGTLLPVSDHDPVAERLEITVAPISTLEADAVCEPDWTTKLWITPKLLGTGDPLDLMIDAPAGTTTAWMLAGFSQQLATVKGYRITVALAGSVLLPLPLDVDGDLALAGKLPNDPGLSGLDFLLQVIGTAGGSQPQTVSNMWIIPVL